MVRNRGEQLEEDRDIWKGLVAKQCTGSGNTEGSRIIYNFSDIKNLHLPTLRSKSYVNLLKAKTEILTSLLHVHTVLWVRPHTSAGRHVNLHVQACTHRT
jgi:hypothetical protein